MSNHQRISELQDYLAARFAVRVKEPRDWPELIMLTGVRDGSDVIKLTLARETGRTVAVWDPEGFEQAFNELRAEGVRAALKETMGDTPPCLGGCGRPDDHNGECQR